jgi:hypothetical protein
MLRQRLITKTNTFHKKVMLANWWLPMAQQEDEWDAQVSMRAGRKVDGSDGVKWVDAVKMNERLNQAAFLEDCARDREIIRKMQKIIDIETGLALQEGQTIVRGRKKRPIRVIKPPKP